MMPRHWQWSFGLLTLLGLGVALGALFGSENAQLPPAQPSAGTQEIRLVGSDSCSGRGCHGGVVPKSNDPNKRQSEYAIWCSADPHTHAYEALTNGQSKEIAKNLNFGAAQEAERCLACHTLPQAAFAKSPLHAERLAGVSCEACHGPANAWLAVHTAPESWKALKANLGPEKMREVYGYVALDDPAKRTAVCAGCHIGAPADPAHGLPLRDMNHDFIAAGHPRLNFEMASFYENLPKHWTEKQEKPVRIARDWSVGQFVALESSLTLLADRANDKSRPWPEFSELDCASCHHDLNGQKGDDLRGKRGLAEAKPGSVPWSSWYREIPSSLAEKQNGPASKELSDGLLKLDKMMTARVPNRERVAKDALALVQQQVRPFVAGLDTKAWSPMELRSLRTTIIQRGQDATTDSWDKSWQMGLSLLTLDQALGLKPMTKQEQLHRELIKTLSLPSGYQSPHRYRPAPLDGELKRLFKELGNE